MIHPRIAFILLSTAVAATGVAACLLGLGAFGEAPANAANALREQLPQPVVDHLLSDSSLDRMTALVITAPATGVAACVANSVRESEQCIRHCEAHRWDRFEYGSGICGFATTCKCDGNIEAPMAVSGSTSR